MEEDGAQSEDQNESARSQGSSEEGGGTLEGRGRNGEHDRGNRHHQQQQEHILPHSYPSYVYHPPWAHQDPASHDYDQTFHVGGEIGGGEQEGDIQQQHHEAYAQYYEQSYYYMMQLWMAHQGYQPLVDQSGSHYQGMEGVPLPPGIPGLGGSTDPLEALLGKFPCARVQNLPYDAEVEDILSLFRGLVLIDVVIIGGGDAFVIFANPMDYQVALRMNRQTIGRRFVDISAASRAEYYEAIATLNEQERGLKHTSGLASHAGTGMRRGERSRDDLPPPGETASTSTVAALWGQTTSNPPSSLQSGFGDSMSLQGGLSLGGRVSSGGGRSVMHAPVQKRTGGGIQVGEHTGFLRMRGLPFSATKEEIYKFFFGYSPIQESIVLTYRNDGRATGEAYVAFASPDDAKRAMELHRRTMGSRYIELFISNKDEHGRALIRFGNR